MSFFVEEIRKDFPILSSQVHGKPLVYLDNAASSQKPRSVIDTLTQYYESQNANIHRGVHYLSQLATDLYEGARKKVQHFINAEKSHEIIYTRGCTESINLVASSFGREEFSEGDEVILTIMEHHSNIVPWQFLERTNGIKLKVVSRTPESELDLEEYRNYFSERTKLVAVAQASNALGTIHPIKEMIQFAHQNGVPVLIDGAQGIPHIKTDVRDLDCDFYAFSGHKLFAPTGIGVLYAKESLLEKMAPYQGGGDMIRTVSFDKTSFNELPYKFEAGTPNISGAIGLGAAIDYLNGIDLSAAFAYEDELLAYAKASLSEIPGMTFIGSPKRQCSVLSFEIDQVHPHDIGTILDREGVAIRSGHHCAMPLMKDLGVPATSRASMSFYNTKAEIDQLKEALMKVLEVFGI